MEFDISPILDNWEYDPDDNIRIIETVTGNKMLQVRLPLGLEQYHLNGRPDGQTPFDYPSLLEYYLDEIRNNSLHNISKDEFLQLQEEGLMFYNRYISLFQIGEYELTRRDTQHNLDLCDLVEGYARDVESKDLLLQYRPYIMHINALSRYMIAFTNKDFKQAESILDQAIQQIETLKPVDTPLFALEVKRSLLNLKKARKSIQKENTDDMFLYEFKLREAVANEEYEEAAKLRDIINNIRRGRE